MRLAPLLLCLAAAAPVAAQPSTWSPSPNGGVAVDARYALGRPLTFTDNQGNELGEGRTSYYAVVPSARIPAAERLAVLVSVPVTVYEASFGVDVSGNESDLDQTDTRVGNPYLGLAVGRPSSLGAPSFEVEAGVWVPLINQEGVFGASQGEAGFALDRENTEAYKNKTVSVRVAARGEIPVTPLLGLRGEVAPVFSYFTGETTVLGGGAVEFPATNLAATAAGFADLRLGMATLTAGARARFEPSAGLDRFADEWFASGVLGLTLEGLPVRPAAHVRTSLTGVDLADPVYGVTVGVPLR